MQLVVKEVDRQETQDGPSPHLSLPHSLLCETGGSTEGQPSPHMSHPLVVDSETIAYQLGQRLAPVKIPGCFLGPANQSKKNHMTPSLLLPK